MMTSWAAIHFLAAKPIADAQFWYAVPLVVAISLVYGGTRHETLKEVLLHAYRSAVWVVGFMAIIFAIIWVAGFWN